MHFPTGQLRIAITLGLQHEGETLWNNGIKQNALFLAEALRGCPNVGDVRLVNMTHVPITGASSWDATRWPLYAFEDVKDEFDIFIELGGQLSFDQTAYLKQRGARLISYCCGSEYVMAMEAILFNRPSFGYNLFVNQRYDAIWMIPQVAINSEPYFTVLRRRPAQVVPFVWEPTLLKQRAAAYPDEGEYRPRKGAARISVMEPNINVVKFCLYPIFIAEEAFRRRPDLVGYLHVTNADRMAVDNKEFVALMNQLDLVRQSKAAFLGRFDTPQFLAEYTDAIVSHQWDNPLNYFYLEVCWQGYPLVHNAHMCRELGYFYPGNDVAAGTAQLLHALQVHDTEWESYRERQRKALERFHPWNAQVRETYTRLLANLMENPVV